MVTRVYRNKAIGKHIREELGDEEMINEVTELAKYLRYD